MTSCTKANLNKGSLVNIDLASGKIACWELDCTVKFQEAVQSSNAVSFTCLFPKVSSSLAMEQSKTDTEVVEYYTIIILNININNVQNS